MKKKTTKITNIVKFPKNLNKLEKQVEAILFAADEPLDIETIEKRVQSTNNIKKILLNLQSDYSLRGINLICSYCEKEFESFLSYLYREITDI